MHKFLFVITFLLSVVVAGQSQEKFHPKKYKKTIKRERRVKDKEMKKGAASPFSKATKRKFKKLKYYPVKVAYRVQAKMKLTPNTEFFEMLTSDGKKRLYRQYGILSFKIKDTALTLPVYQSKRLMRMPQYRNYLFAPFTDPTNGNTTYGAGRYLGLYITQQKVDDITLDFNKAYNPYCAYNSSYSCPIPPKANHLNVAIEAGEKQYKKY